MKLALLAAGLTLGLLAAAPAAAKPPHDNGMHGDRHDMDMRGDRDRPDMDLVDRVVRMDRHDLMGRHDRGHHYGWRDHYNRGHHYGWRNHRHCPLVWMHHRRMRVC